jgi:hypothetical protein
MVCLYVASKIAWQLCWFWHAVWVDQQGNCNTLTSLPLRTQQWASSACATSTMVCLRSAVMPCTNGELPPNDARADTVLRQMLCCGCTSQHDGRGSVAQCKLKASGCMCADDLAGMYYGPRHPMKPQRITMTHHLILGYALHEHMDVYVCLYYLFVHACIQECEATMASAADGSSCMSASCVWATHTWALVKPCKLH